MGLVDKKSIKLEGVRDFLLVPRIPSCPCTSPSRVAGTSLRVALIELPSKRGRSRTSSRCLTFACSGSSRAITSPSRWIATPRREVDVQRVRAVPRQGARLPDGGVGASVEHEDCGVCVGAQGSSLRRIHGDGARPDVSFYTMIDKESQINKVKLIGTIKNKTANHLFWSPQGKAIVLAGLKTMNGQFEFFNVTRWRRWPPANHHGDGRGVGSHRPLRRHRGDERAPDGERLPRLDLQRAAVQARQERFTSFCGAPAPSLLSKEKEEEIVKNLKKYSSASTAGRSIRGQQDSHLAARSRRCSTRGTDGSRPRRRRSRRPSIGAGGGAHREVSGVEARGTRTSWRNRWRWRRSSLSRRAYAA